jgi:hypothetical protein
VNKKLLSWVPQWTLCFENRTVSNADKTTVKAWIFPYCTIKDERIGTIIASITLSSPHPKIPVSEKYQLGIIKINQDLFKKIGKTMTLT